MTLTDMERMARADARGPYTGWAHWRGIRCAYYPVSKRYRWFSLHGVTNRSDIAKQMDELNDVRAAQANRLSNP